MKKIIVCILSITILFSCVVVCNAAETTKYIEDLDITITVPSEFYVFTRDMEDDYSGFEVFDCTKTEMVAELESKGIYLDAFDEDINYEIAVIDSGESEVDNFNSLGDKFFTVFEDTFIEAYKEKGVEVLKTDTYQHSQALFFVCYFCNETDTSFVDYGLQYYTAYNKKAVSITFHSYCGEISAENELMMRLIIDGLTFGTEPQIQTTTDYEEEQSDYEEKTIPADEINDIDDEPDVLDEEIDDRDEETKDSAGEKFLWIGLVIAAIVIVVLIAVIIILLSRKKSGRTQGNFENKPMPTAAPEPPVNRQPPVKMEPMNVSEYANRDINYQDINRINRDINVNTQNFCSNCGMELNSTSKFCENCGAKLNQ